MRKLSQEIRLLEGLVAMDISADIPVWGLASVGQFARSHYYGVLG